MGWAVGYDSNWKRDIGYGVPSVCDHPDCDEEIDRGLSYVCGSEPYGGEFGCGLYFCETHRCMFDEPEAPGGCVSLCERCWKDEEPFDPKPDVMEWVKWKLTDESWGEWRLTHPDEAIALLERVKEDKARE